MFSRRSQSHTLSFKASSKPALHAAYTILDRKLSLKKQVEQDNFSLWCRLKDIEIKRGPFASPLLCEANSLAVDPRERFRLDFLKKTRKVEEENERMNRRLIQRKSTVGKYFRIHRLESLPATSRLPSHPESSLPPSRNEKNTLLMETVLPEMEEEILVQIRRLPDPKRFSVHFLKFDGQTYTTKRLRFISPSFCFLIRLRCD